jgi:hypothetical protein
MEGKYGRGKGKSLGNAIENLGVRLNGDIVAT